MKSFDSLDNWHEEFLKQVCDACLRFVFLLGALVAFVATSMFVRFKRSNVVNNVIFSNSNWNILACAVLLA